MRGILVAALLLAGCDPDGQPDVYRRAEAERALSQSCFDAGYAIGQLRQYEEDHDIKQTLREKDNQQSARDTCGWSP